MPYARLPAPPAEIRLPYPAKCTRRWRDALLAQYPALVSHPRRQTYLRMVEYILHSTLREDDSGRLVVPAAALALLDKARQTDRDQDGQLWSARDLLEAFSTDVWPLDISSYVPAVRARTIDPMLPDAVLALPEGGAVYDPLDADRWVWLVSGSPVTPTSRRKAAGRYAEGISYLTDHVDTDHPAACLLRYLNDQPAVTLGKLIRSNWGRLSALLEAMPTKTHDDHVRRDSAAYTLGALSDRTEMVYTSSENSARIHTVGTTIHQLPRAMRKTALAGAVEMDVRSSQLAIVAKLWDLPGVTEFLVAKRSVWTELSEAMGVDQIHAKATLKEALYATCYGMGRAKIQALLRDGSRKNPGLGSEAAREFMEHPLIKEVLQGRTRAMKRVADAGGLHDAWGRWYEAMPWGAKEDKRDLPDDPDCPMPPNRHPHHSLLAIEAQSWELRLMLPVFGVIEKSTRASILSWLHDGVVIWMSDRRPERTAELVGAAKELFDTGAAALGFSTDLEIECL